LRQERLRQATHSHLFYEVASLELIRSQCEYMEHHILTENQAGCGSAD